MARWSRRAWRHKGGPMKGGVSCCQTKLRWIKRQKCRQFQVGTIIGYEVQVPITSVVLHCTRLRRCNASGIICSQTQMKGFFKCVCVCARAPKICEPCKTKQSSLYDWPRHWPTRWSACSALLLPAVNYCDRVAGKNFKLSGSKTRQTSQSKNSKRFLIVPGWGQM